MKLCGMKIPNELTINLALEDYKEFKKIVKGINKHGAVLIDSDEPSPARELVLRLENGRLIPGSSVRMLSIGDGYIVFVPQMFPWFGYD